MPEKRNPNPDGGDTGTVTETRTKPKEKLKRPPMYRVLLHNDNYTTRDFVVAVLKEVFHKSETDAVQIMLHVHYNGIGVAGVYPYEVAETKMRLTEKLARENEYPLRLSMEPEDD
jgi:ATP-dependent Clp protease adaptor protein ClpS